MTDDLTPPTEQVGLDEFDLNEAPRWPKVVGIISVVWGGIGLTCGGCGMGTPAIMGFLMGSQLNGAPLPPLWTFGPLDYVLGVLGIVMAIVLVVAGVQTILRRRLGRALHLVYAVVVLPMIVVSALNGFSKQSAMAQWAKDYPDNEFAQRINAGGPDQMIELVVGVAMILFFMLYPLFCLIWFGLIKNKHEQMTGGVEEVF